MEIKVTPLRITVLEFIKRRPGAYASAIAEKVSDRRWSRQGATRYGCGYAEPMVKAGWLRKDIYVDVGGARYWITDAGLLVLSEALQEPITKES